MEQGIWARDFLISPELCGMDGRLGALGGLTLFQALAAEHAEQIGVGFAAMARRQEFWLTVHCRIELLQPAALMETVTGETWPEACRAESVRCFRSYRLRRGGEILAVGRTEWAILGGAGKVVPFGESGFPPEFPFPDRAAIDQRPRRFVDDFTDPGERWPVRSTDIDLGRHVNNLAYVRAMLGCCTAEELTRIRTLEIHYAAPCLEGETLRLCRRDDGAETRFAVKKETGKAAALAAVTFRART